MSGMEYRGPAAAAYEAALRQDRHIGRGQRIPPVLEERRREEQRRVWMGKGLGYVIDPNPNYPDYSPGPSGNGSHPGSSQNLVRPSEGQRDHQHGHGGYNFQRDPQTHGGYDQPARKRARYYANRQPREGHYSPPSLSRHRESPPPISNRIRMLPPSTATAAPFASRNQHRSSTATATAVRPTDNENNDSPNGQPSMEPAKSMELPNGETRLYLPRPKYMDELAKNEYRKDVQLICRDGELWTNKLILINAAPTLGVMLDDQLPGEITVMTMSGYSVQGVKYFLDFACKGTLNLPKEWRLVVIRMMYDFGWTSPNITLTDLQGNEIPLDSDDAPVAPKSTQLGPTVTLRNPDAGISTSPIVETIGQTEAVEPHQIETVETPQVVSAMNDAPAGEAEAEASDDEIQVIIPVEKVFETIDLDASDQESQVSTTSDVSPSKSKKLKSILSASPERSPEKTKPSPSPKKQTTVRPVGGWYDTTKKTSPIKIASPTAAAEKVCENTSEEFPEFSNPSELVPESSDSSKPASVASIAVPSPEEHDTGTTNDQVAPAPVECAAEKSNSSPEEVNAEKSNDQLAPPPGPQMAKKSTRGRPRKEKK